MTEHFDPQLFLDVAEVFVHPEGQEAWWESYERRSPVLRQELVDDLRRRLDREEST